MCPFFDPTVYVYLVIPMFLLCMCETSGYKSWGIRDALANVAQIIAQFGMNGDTTNHDFYEGALTLLAQPRTTN
jgi:hypothetical protein